MSDDEVWTAFRSTPPPIEPVSNRDNSLAGFQRRLLEKCASDLCIAEQLLARCYAMLAQIAVGLAPTGYGDLMVDMDDFRERHL